MSKPEGSTKPRSRDVNRVPKSPRERKAAFDARMRNQGRRLDPDEPERSACVLYLSQPARHVLRDHREQARLLMEGPRRDSQLVEALLLSVKQTATLNESSRHDLSKSEVELRKSNEILRKRVLDLRKMLRDTASRLSAVEANLPETLCDRHREEFSHSFAAMLSDVILAVSERGTNASIRHKVHRLLMGYMLGLLDTE